MGIFYLKFRDTRPTLEVVLKNPDGSVHDLTGSTDWKLHIWLADGTKLVRTMVKVAPDTAGMLRYAWVATDWNPGALVAVPLPLAPGGLEHRMEYEVLGPASERLTFPNTGYDVLRVLPDIGQG